MILPRVGLVLLVLIGAGCGGEVDGASTSTTATGRPVGSTATAPSVAPTTAPPVAPEAPTAPLPADAPVLDAEGAVLAAVGLERAGKARPFAAGAVCEALAEQVSLVECGIVSAADGSLVWVVERSAGTPSDLRVVLWREADGRATPVLEAVDPGGQQFAGVHVEAADLDGVPGLELVAGFRVRGSGAFLELDVVGGDGTVLFHRSLDHGRARLGEGGVEDWSARYGPEDPNCCPGTFVQERLVADGTSWRVASSALVSPDVAPSGQFP